MNYEESKLQALWQHTHHMHRIPFAFSMTNTSNTSSSAVNSIHYSFSFLSLHAHLPLTLHFILHALKPLLASHFRSFHYLQVLTTSSGQISIPGASRPSKLGFHCLLKGRAVERRSQRSTQPQGTQPVYTAHEREVCRRNGCRTVPTPPRSCAGQTILVC